MVSSMIRTFPGAVSATEFAILFGATSVVDVAAVWAKRLAAAKMRAKQTDFMAVSRMLGLFS
jgi:hypothetical protein